MTTSDHLPAPVLERLAALTPDQRAAATAPPGPVLCVAPAGSGKTTTLLARIAWRMALGEPPGSICAVTFNRRAAEELEERLDASLAPLGCEPGAVRVRTFHALGREILADAGVDVSAIVDRAALLSELAGVTGRDPLPPAVLRHLDDVFSRLKLDPERGPPPSDQWTHQAFALYQAALSKRRALDLDDLVARAVPALRADQKLLARWRSRCRVLFVDEAQDLDRAQLELALVLAGDRRDIFLVGDDDQTIYAWRLADVRRILSLASRLPMLRRVDLVTNHRCPPEVVRRAARLVARNRERFAKRIEPSASARGSLTLMADPGDDVARARALLAAWGGQPGGRAILARTNAELRPYAAAALELGLPFRIDDDGLIVDHASIPAALEAAASHEAAGAPLLVAVARGANEAGAPREVRGSLLAWAAGAADVAGLRHAIERVVRDRGAQREDPSSDRARREVEREAGAARPSPAATGPPLALATVHGTKGLEWDHVACVGFDADSFPAARSIREAADPDRALEEERRLAYVAWTRARRSLVIVYDPGAPSRFLRDAFDDAELAVPAA